MGVCSECGKGICDKCAVEIGGKLYCKSDADKVFGAPMKKAPTPVPPTAPKAPTAPPAPVMEKKATKPYLAVVFAIIGGTIAAAGVFLPWMSGHVGDTEVTGVSGWEITAFHISPYVVLIGAAIVFLGALAILAGPKEVSSPIKHTFADKMCILIMLGAIILIISGAWGYSYISDVISTQSYILPAGVEARVGAGIWAAIGGGILALFALSQFWPKD